MSERGPEWHAGYEVGYADGESSVMADWENAREREGDRLDRVLAVFEERTKAVPVGHEIQERGCSTYNWRQSLLRELREIAEELDRECGAEAPSVVEEGP